MALGINTNIASLIAQRNLTTSGDKLSVAVQRLSSGLRINSAKDDAAGLGISERMSSQIRGLDQAARNANDGVSLAQTGEGALAEISNNLQRIRELAVQAANSTNSASDRTALDAEVQQRIAEINRTASTASFNNQKILDGNFGTATFQVGANVGETIGVALSTSMKTTAIGSYVNSAGANTTGNNWTTVAAAGGNTYNATNANFTGSGVNTYANNPTGVYAGVSSTAFDGSNFSLNGTSIKNSANYVGTSAPTYQDSTSAYAKAAAINASNVAGVTASANTTLTFGTSGGTAANGTDFLVLWAGNGITASVNYTLSINGQAVLNYSALNQPVTQLPTTTIPGVSIDSAVQSINAHSGTTGVAASKTSNGTLQLVAADGRNIQISEAITGLDSNGITGGGGAYMQTAFSKLEQLVDNGAAPSVTQTQTARGQIALQSSAGITLGGTQTTAGFSGATTQLIASGSLSAQSVTTVANANNTIRSVDSAIDTVNSLRGTFGSIQNRFGSVVASLMSTSENLSAARSRILDADFSQETATMTKASIAQQAGVAMLAQANALPQQVLALLRG